jgi:hypothetical protein
MKERRLDGYIIEVIAVVDGCSRVIVLEPPLSTA